jgi:transposase
MGYPTDLTDSQWELIKHHFGQGRRRKYDKHTLVNAVLYLVKTGCQWRMLPKDFPPYQTVHSFYRRARIKGIWAAMMDDLVKKTRQKADRQETPTYALIDSQSVKTTLASAERGIDGGKKRKDAKDI